MLKLVLIAAACATLLAIIHSWTGDHIARNASNYELKQITDLAGTPPPAGTTWTGDVWDFCGGTKLARSSTPGYGGPIRLVVGVSQGRILGVRVTAHQETPGLADFLREPERGWLALLKGRTGQEAVAVGCIQACRPEDPVVTAYRDHGHALARGMAARHCMAEMFGRIGGCAKGKGGSMHMFDKANNLFGGHGIVGAHTPLGAGLAFATKSRRTRSACLRRVMSCSTVTTPAFSGSATTCATKERISPFTGASSSTSRGSPGSAPRMAS